MTIERIHFDRPHSFDVRQDPIRQTREIVLANMGKSKPLPEGEYDLTPTSWRVNTHKHNLIVNSDGTAVYRLLPKEERSGMVDSRTLDYQPGGRVIRIPQEQEVAVVAGGTPEREVGIYEIIFYTPGTSPMI